jgi:hypothetical protein
MLKKIPDIKARGTDVAELTASKRVQQSRVTRA